jgi:hypothetical protein
MLTQSKPTDEIQAGSLVPFPSPQVLPPAHGPESARREQGGRFAQGQSGNPAGRPRGARNKTTLAALALLEEEAEAITRKAIEMAKAGDIVAIKLCLERLIPPRREPVDLEVYVSDQSPEERQAAVAREVRALFTSPWPLISAAGAEE